MLEARIEIFLEAKVLSFRIRFAYFNVYLFAGEDYTSSTFSAHTLLCVVFRNQVVDRVIQVVSSSAYLLVLATDGYLLQRVLASTYYSLASAVRKKA